MSNVVDAFTVFFDHLRAIAWTPVLYGLACQLGRALARSRAWRNVVAAAYPESTVRWRTVFGAEVAGAGVNALIPVRGGDALKLYLVHRRVEDATYTTLASSLLVPAIFDLLLGGALLLWALQQHVLPGVGVMNRLPSVDWFWLFRHPRAAAAVAAGTLVLGFAFGIWAARRVAAFRERVARAFAVLHSPRRYLRGVVAWQLVDWALRVAAAFFLLRAFHVHASVVNALRVQVTQSLSTIVPLTPSGIGTKQALIVYVLGGEAPRSALLSFSVGMEAIFSVWTIALGASALLATLRTLRWRDAIGDHGGTPGSPV